jgi:hypothetical protein
LTYCAQQSVVAVVWTLPVAAPPVVEHVAVPDDEIITITPFAMTFAHVPGAGMARGGIVMQRLSE